MANNTNDFTAKLKLILDKASITNIKKILSKEKLTVNAKVEIDESSSLNSLKNVMRDISSQLPTAGLMDGFITSLQQSVTELKELDHYLTKISKTDLTISTSQLAKIGESSLKNTPASSDLNGQLSIVNEITQKMGSLATTDISKGLLSGIKNFGRPKMSGLSFQYADYHKCSLGY